MADEQEALKGFGAAILEVLAEGGLGVEDDPQVPELGEKLERGARDPKGRSRRWSP